MSLRELFPIYPLILRSPPESNIRFGTRVLYVDLPAQAYNFLFQIMSQALKNELSFEEVKEKWQKFLLENKDSLTLNNKPFVSVSLRYSPLSDKSFLRLDVKWKLFIEYLENKASNFLGEVEKDGRNIMKVYEDIWKNFFRIFQQIVYFRPQYFTLIREKFKKLLKRTGDYNQIMNLLDQFENMMNYLVKFFKKIPEIHIYTTNFIMDIKHLRVSIENINIPAAYLLLRNLLENFVKMFVYLDLCKSFYPNTRRIILSSIFFYEYEILGGNRIYSFKKFKDKWLKHVLKILETKSLTYYDEYNSKIVKVDILEVVKLFKEKQIPTLGIKPEVLRKISEEYKLEEVKLDIIYSACSSIIHNQPPLPFFSLLEIKFFKKFLEKYLDYFQKLVEKITNKKIERIELYSKTFGETEKMHRKCLKIANELWTKYRSEIENIITKTMKEIQGGVVNPSLLVSTFNLISPTLTSLKESYFYLEDFEYVLDNLQLISYRRSLSWEIINTLSALIKALIPKMRKYKEFLSLKSNNQKELTVFYLLLLCLPDVTSDLIEKKIDH